MWILCRTPVLDETVVGELLGTAQSMGYDIDKAIRVEQDW